MNGSEWIIDHGLIVRKDSDPLIFAGYIFNFTSHGSFDPDGSVGDFTKEEIDRHNEILSDFKWMDLLGSGSGVLYLIGNLVSDWVNKHTVRISRIRKSFHNMAGRNGRTDVWFFLDGSVWHGVNIGDNQILRVRRTNARRC